VHKNKTKKCTKWPKFVACSSSLQSEEGFYLLHTK